MLSPIPIRALIHTVTHSPLVATSRGKTYPTSATLNNVLVQNKSLRQATTSGYITVSGAIMFWDVVHSTAAVFNIGDKITFNGVDKFVVDILDATTTEGLHHKELTLI